MSEGKNRTLMTITFMDTETDRAIVEMIRAGQANGYFSTAVAYVRHLVAMANKEK